VGQASKAAQARVHRYLADKLEAEVAADEANVDPAQEHHIQ
jgi:hypothetical protein